MCGVGEGVINLQIGIVSSILAGLLSPASFDAVAKKSKVSQPSSSATSSWITTDVAVVVTGSYVTLDLVVLFTSTT